MKALIISLKIIGYTWLISMGIPIVIGIITLLIKEGFWKTIFLLSPLNFVEHLVVLAIMIPGLAALILANHLEFDRIRKKRFQREL